MDRLLKVSLVESSILHISLNRAAALNALNAELMQDLQQCFLQARQDAAVKAVLLTGEGKGFCAGADIKQLLNLDRTTGAAFARQGQAIFRSLEQLGKPSLAAVKGFAFGGGCELAMAATLRIADIDAVFGQPEVKLGVIPGFGGTQRLARLIGKGRALEMCLTGKTINAADALAWGLVSETVVEAELIPRGIAILQSLLLLAPLALKSVMTAIDQGYDLPMPEACELEAEQFGLCCDTQDKAEGVSAFIEKRTPKFIGA